MRKITILAISSILCMLLCCCATTVNTVPDWVFGKQDYETSGKYLLAVGSGRSRDAAEKDARQNLASFFGANINSQSYFGSTYYEKGGTAQTSQVYNSDLLIDVKVDDLAGIEEIDSFLDSDGVFYVLLGMNKRPQSCIPWIPGPSLPSF